MQSVLFCAEFQQSKSDDQQQQRVAVGQQSPHFQSASECDTTIASKCSKQV